MVIPTLSHCDSAEIDTNFVYQLEKEVIDIQTANRVAEVFKALSDPTRLRIISALVERELCVHTLTEVLGMSQSAISHQLRLMRQIHLVRYRKEGRHVYYTLDDDHIQDLFQQSLLHVKHE
jgi:DNA-binding transcriptional ArsR family regulator